MYGMVWRFLGGGLVKCEEFWSYCHLESVFVRTDWSPPFE